MVISGAGPTLLAIANPERVEQVVKSMLEAWNSLGIESQVRSLAINPSGAKVI